MQASSAAPQVAAEVDAPAQEPKLKKSRTNTPWTPAEELRLKQMRDAGNSWSEIAKVRKHEPWCGISSERSENYEIMVADSSATPDVSATNRRKREETLVQGRPDHRRCFTAQSLIGLIRICITQSSPRTK
jgi:hypothetical protein